jgi:hypothetical protein
VGLLPLPFSALRPCYGWGDALDDRYAMRTYRTTNGRVGVKFSIMARRIVTDHWFVSVEALRRGRLAPWTPRRETKTFPTEAKAKQYAKEMLSDSHKIIAGTLLNGYQPVRRIIPASELSRWIEKK